MNIDLTETERETISRKLKQNAEIVDAAIEKYLSLNDNDYNILFESMRYSSLSGGKRIRAFLALEFFSVFNNVGRDDPGAPCINNNDPGAPCINNGVPGGHALQNNAPEMILPVAAAIEMIHTYSLIHDDLPCMDDDDLRRGQPTNHKKFGEATAVLAGDALLTYAFNIIANAEFLTDGKKVRIISEISRAAGHMGMIGGQMIDMINENKNIDIIKLVKMHTLKTGNMIIVSARAGCIAGGATDEEIVKASEYAKNIGLAFQVIDDILDITGETEILGKNVQSDIKNQKNTFVNIFNGDKNEQSSFIDTFKYAAKLTEEAVLNLEELKKINKNADTKNLEILAKYLLERKS